MASDSPRPRTRRLLLWAGVYAVLSAGIMYPASLDPARLKYGGFAVSDSLDTVYQLWAETERLAPGADGTLHNPAIGAPSGAPPPANRLPLTWQLARAGRAIGGPVFGFNLPIFVGFFLSALLTHLLLVRLTGSEPAAVVGATAFAFSPFHVLQSADHVNLAQTWVFPLYFLALQRDWRAPSAGSAVGVAATIGLALWIHGYYGLFLMLLSPCLYAVLLLSRTLSWDREQAGRLALLSAAVVVIALAWARAMGSYAVPARPIDDLYHLGIRWYEWLLPPFYSALFGEAVQDFLATRMHGSNPAEMTVFLGYGALLLVLVFGVARWRGRPDPAGPGPFVPCMLVTALLAMVLGTRPRIELMGVGIPMPSGLLHVVFPMLRAVSRWAVLAIFAVSCLAGLGLAILLGPAPRTSRAWLAAGGVVGILLLEFSPARADFFLDMGTVPPLYARVRELPGDPVVLELPVTSLADFLPYAWQRHHGKRLYNVPDPEHPNAREILLMQARTLPGILARARALDIDYLVLHTSEPLRAGRYYAPVRIPNLPLDPSLPHAALVPVSPEPSPTPERARRGAGRRRGYGR